MITTVTLNTCIDHLITVRRLVHDDAMRPVTEARRAGGKGVNVSRILHALGVPTRAYVLVGGWTGEELVKLLEAEGVPVRRFPVSHPTRVNVAVTDLSNGRQLRLLSAGPRVAPLELARLRDSILSAPRGAFCCIFSGSLPPGLAPGTYRSLIRSFQSKGIRCVLDSDGPALREGVKARPFCIKPNQYEMERLAGTSLSTEKKLIHAAMRFVDDGTSHVVVSLEGKGALFASRFGPPFWARPPAVRVRSRVGAGDTLLAGFIAGLSLGKTPQEAARLATASASAWVTLTPGMRLVRARIRSLVNKVRIEAARY